MNRLLTGLFASALALSATAPHAQAKPPLKIGGILDMSSLYADITGPGSLEAAKMAAEDAGGEVLGRKIEVIAADHLNKADLAANIARDMIDNQGVEMIYDVAASATALAAGEMGLRSALIDRMPLASLTDAGFDGRTTAIAYTSQRLFAALGVWDEVAGEAEPIRDIRISDASHDGRSSSLFLHFDHREAAR